MTTPARFSDPSILPVNDTLVFYTPMQVDLDDTTIVRTGTLGEGSCLYHSVLHACSGEYAGSSVRRRLKMVKQLRASLAGIIDQHEWEKLGRGLIARISFTENVNIILTDTYASIEGKRPTRSVSKVLDGWDDDLKKIITDLLPLDSGFEKTILPAAYKRSEDGGLQDCKSAMRKEVVKYLGARDDLSSLSDKKLAYLKKVVIDFTDRVTDVAETLAYNEYIAGLGDVSETVDQKTIGLISDKFERDIYFVDGRTRMPYQNASSPDNLRGRRSVIILWVGGVHYEIMGRLVEGDYGRTVQREFSPNDPLIRKFKTFLCDPERVADTYPDLVEYLPSRYQTFDAFAPSPSSSYGSSPCQSMSDSD